MGGGTPPPPRSIGIMGLGRKSRQVFGFKGLIGKVFRNKGLGVLNRTDKVLVSLFIGSAPVAMVTPPPLKAGAKTKGVAGGHALILVELSANFGFAVWRLRIYLLPHCTFAQIRGVRCDGHHTAFVMNPGSWAARRSGGEMRATRPRPKSKSPPKQSLDGAPSWF